MNIFTGNFISNLMLIVPIALSVLIFICSSKAKYFFTLILSLYVVVITSIPALNLIIDSASKSIDISLFSLSIKIDNLSAFFILITNFTMLMGLLYANGYLKIYKESKNSFQFSLHYFSFLWLHLSMLGVLMIRDGLAFLITWELMAVSSFILILFESEKRAILKTAVNYLIQMHIGFVFLLIAFLICLSNTGTISFDALKLYFENNNSFLLFFLFFIGFAIKAGFVPLHTWLPEAHPAAPSHVSGVMSGVMIKMGIYGIVRVLTYIHTDLYYIGLFILVLSAVTGLYGIIMAITQKDFKKILAYSSIENIGIIGIGIGLGTIGLGINNPTLAILGFVGGLLHVLNHSLFKSLLFFNSGSVYKNYHTRNIEQLGGVLKKMPKTGTFFLIGSIAICGLPPLNGFISEIIIYTGLFKGLSASGFNNSIAMMLAIVALTLIGGLAIFNFTKTFSVIFLGTSRKKHDEDNISEVSNQMLFPKVLITILIFIIGIFPLIFVNPLIRIVSSQFGLHIDISQMPLTGSLTKISIIGFILFATIIILFYLRTRLLKKRTVEFQPTWGCGSVNTNEQQQYTGTSFANNFKEIASPVFSTHEKYKPIHENDIFPTKRRFETDTNDVFESIIDKFVSVFSFILKKLARLQTGLIQHYILYAFVFILILFLLLYLNIL